jgi:hypothetical protein
MLRRILLLALALSLAAPAAAQACNGGYAYAGLFGESAVAGVSATLTPTGPAVVTDGHVAAWVNVGSASAWLQVGLNTTSSGEANALYYEYRAPGAADTVYVPIRTVDTGARARVAILEVEASVWQVSVDGVPASPRLFLRGSHGRWHGSVAAEAFTRAAGACAAYGYSFRDVGALTRGRWSASALVAAVDPGYRLVRLGTGAFDTSAI